MPLTNQVEALDPGLRVREDGDGLRSRLPRLPPRDPREAAGIHEELDSLEQVRPGKHTGPEALGEELVEELLAGGEHVLGKELALAAVDVLVPVPRGTGPLYGVFPEDNGHGEAMGEIMGEDKAKLRGEGDSTGAMRDIMEHHRRFGLMAGSSGSGETVADAGPLGDQGEAWAMHGGRGFGGSGVLPWAFS
jgi:hypothetical protein